MNPQRVYTSLRSEKPKHAHVTTGTVPGSQSHGVKVKRDVTFTGHQNNPSDGELMRHEVTEG